MVMEVRLASSDLRPHLVMEVRLAPSDQEQSYNMVLEQTLLKLGSRPKAILTELLRHHKGGS